MDKLVILLSFFCLSARAEIFLQRTNVVRNVPVHDTSVFGTQIAYNPSNGLHVAWYTNNLTTSNLIMWTDGSWISNKVVTNFVAPNGLALGTNCIVGTSIANRRLYESTWPAGVAVTNMALTNSMGAFLTPTQGIVVAGRLTGILNYKYRWTDGTWSATNVDHYGSQGDVASFTGLGLDRNIYTLFVEDAAAGHPVGLIRMIETNTVLEVLNNYTNYFPQYGELPKFQFTQDVPGNRLLIASIRGQHPFGAIPCLEIVATLGVWAISNNLGSNTIMDLPAQYLVARVEQSGIAIPGTNTIYHFAQAALATNSCTYSPIMSQFTYASSNITAIGQLEIMARSQDNWVLYKGNFGEWKLTKIVPP